MCVCAYVFVCMCQRVRERELTVHECKMWIIWVPSNAGTHQHLNIVLVPPRCLYVASFTLTFKERKRENDCAVIIWAKLEELVFDCSRSSARRGFLGVGAQARLVSQPGANQLVWRNVGHPNSWVGYLGMWSLSLSLLVRPTADPVAFGPSSLLDSKKWEGKKR